MIANAASDWAQLVVTALLGLVTAYIGLSIRQKRRQEIAVNVADHRLDAYGALWSKIPLSPELRDLTGAPPRRSPDSRRSDSRRLQDRHRVRRLHTR